MAWCGLQTRPVQTAYRAHTRLAERPHLLLSFTTTLCTSPVWLPAGAIRQRGSTSVKADVDVFIRAVTAAQDPFNTPAYLALFHARCSRGSVPSLWEFCHVILTWIGPDTHCLILTTEWVHRKIVKRMRLWKENNKTTLAWFRVS